MHGTIIIKPCPENQKDMLIPLFLYIDFALYTNLIGLISILLPEPSYHLAILNRDVLFGIITIIYFAHDASKLVSILLNG